MQNLAFPIFAELVKFYLKFYIYGLKTPLEAINVSFLKESELIV